MNLNTKFDRNRPRNVKHYFVKETKSCACGSTEDFLKHTEKQRHYRERTRLNGSGSMLPRGVNRNHESIMTSYELLVKDGSGWSLENPMLQWARRFLSQDMYPDIRQKILDFKGDAPTYFKDTSEVTNPRGWVEGFEKFTQWVESNGRLPQRSDGTPYWFMDRTRRYIKSGDRLRAKQISEYKRVLLKAKGYTV